MSIYSWYYNVDKNYLPFCFSFIVCCNNPAQGPPGYLLHKDKNGIISALLEYHCLLAAAAAATDAIDVTILVLFRVDATDDKTEFSLLLCPSSQQDGNVFVLRLLQPCPSSINTHKK